MRRLVEMLTNSQRIIWSGVMYTSPTMVRPPFITPMNFKVGRVGISGFGTTDVMRISTSMMLWISLKSGSSRIVLSTDSSAESFN